MDLPYPETMLLSALSKQVEKHEITINFNSLVQLIQRYTKRAAVGSFNFTRDIYLQAY